MKKLWSRLQRLVKEEKGLTLIELLAVIVILGIIAAIAVPAITGITNNTKREAHKANAHQMVEAAKQIVAVNGFKPDYSSDNWTPNTVDSDGKIKAGKAATAPKSNVMEISLAEMITLGYFTGIKDPEASDGSDYTSNAQIVRVYKDGSTYSYFVTINSANDSSDFTDIPEADIDKLVLK
ncbi:type II secretion system protein [Brevibacillus fluminis]|uniref:type II secretion system protein n=1 Tax=Brevibacillus fluminis TaxID=511487 RepID=UPI003F8C1F85